MIFSCLRVVHRGDWATQTHLDTHVSENMISEICHLDRERGGWVLKIEADEGFVEGYVYCTLYLTNESQIDTEI